MLLSVLVIGGGIFNKAVAIQMEAGVSPSQDTAQASFKGDRILTFTYPDGSPIAKLLNGKKESVSFTLNSSDPNNGINTILSQINDYLLKEKQSQVKFENATVNYRATLNGGPVSTSVSYQVELKPVMTNLVTSTNGSDTSIVDLDWRGIVLNGPMVVNTPEFGKIDINIPAGGLEKLIPNLAPQLINSTLSQSLNQPLMNFEEFAVTMGNWHFLFDATGAQAGASSFGMNLGKGDSKIISIYSLGESSFREGTHTVKETDTSTTIDGTQVKLHTLTAPPSGQIQIGGFSKIQQSSNHEFAIVSTKAPQGVETSSGGFPVQVLLIFGGMMAAIAALVLIKARK